VQIANPSDEQSYTHRMSEAKVREELASWDGSSPSAESPGDPILRRVRELAEAEGVDWVYMGEIGAGTGAAFYPPWMLMWVIEEPDLFREWLELQKARCFPATERTIRDGCAVIAMGGDVSCDKGPFISPAHYREFLLPVIQEHVELIHKHGALAVYTSDGNHWPIKEEFFFLSGVDGYKEVDQAAGMTMEHLIEEGIDRRVCIIGNLDARHTLCHGTQKEVKAEVIKLLKLGQTTPGGHILHASHSVHEDVKPENYYAAVDAYREFFGLEPLPR
jgi:uroporphyrinogen-III decarboxylase